jgi:hypothetical protein
MRGFRYKSFLLFLSISAMVVAMGESSNFKLFRDCLASLIIEKRSYEPSRKPKKAGEMEGSRLPSLQLLLSQSLTMLKN